LLLFWNFRHNISFFCCLKMKVAWATICVATPLWGKCEDETHTPEIGTWEYSRALEISEFDYRGQNTLHWGVIYIIGKLLMCRCRKWPRMNHLDIGSRSYGQKKGRESNCQFDSWPLKVENRPNPGMCRWSATHRWKALKESYKFALDLVLIGDRSEKLWTPKVPGVQTGTILGFHFGSPRKKCHSNASAVERRKEYHMGEGGGFPRIRAVVSQVSPELPVVCPSTKGVSENDLTNLLFGFDAGSSKWIACPSS
jgi:hypothetical protein